VLHDDSQSGPDSDVDVLVEFEPGALVSLFTLADIQDELSALLGRPVDLVPRDGLKPVIRDEVLAGEHVLYAALSFHPIIRSHPLHPLTALLPSIRIQLVLIRKKSDN